MTCDYLFHHNQNTRYYTIRITAYYDRNTPTPRKMQKATPKGGFPLFSDVRAGPQVQLTR